MILGKKKIGSIFGSSSESSHFMYLHNNEQGLYFIFYFFSSPFIRLLSHTLDTFLRAQTEDHISFDDTRYFMWATCFSLTFFQTLFEKWSQKRTSLLERIYWQWNKFFAWTLFTPKLKVGFKRCDLLNVGQFFYKFSQVRRIHFIFNLWLNAWRQSGNNINRILRNNFDPNIGISTTVTHEYESSILFYNFHKKKIIKSIFVVCRSDWGGEKRFCLYR